MRRLANTLLAASLLALAAAPSASAEFGFSEFDVTYTDGGGEPVTQAGAHPPEQTTSFSLNTRENEFLGEIPDEALKDQILFQIEGLVGDPNATPRCSSLDFLFGRTAGSTNCAEVSAVGVVRAHVIGAEIAPLSVPVYNLEPPPGAAARLGFNVAAVRTTIDIGVNPEPPYNIVARTENISQIVPLFGAEVTLWGDPSDSSHDDQRGPCAGFGTGCSVSVADPRAFLTMPRACQGPLRTDYRIRSWDDPADTLSGFVETHDEAGEPEGMSGCAELDFAPEVAAAPTTNRASSPSGLDFSIDVEDPGLTDPDELAASDLKKAVVTLPEGLAVNPASAGGIGVCTEADLAREAHDSAPGEGCPQASKLASVEVTTPLLAERLSGSVFLAEPFANPFDTLLAGYLVIKQPERGIVLKVPGRIDTDPDTGRITASFDQNPQLPFDHLEVSFPAGPRASLTTPPTCGDYEIVTELHPWSGTPAVTETDAFTISQAPGGGACPGSEAELPHAPGFDAGAVSPLAGRHSPFVINLRREDGSQRFSVVELTPPPGLTAKLAATPYCSDAALAAAASSSGRAERRSPSCPSASRVGSVYAAAGSGPAPYWTSGAAYLAGPYKGAPLSLAIVTPALAGPFDLGVVVIRSALHLDPRTAQITAVSDPIPEILEGVPLDIRTASIRLDKPGFTLNPTSCDAMGVSGELLSTAGVAAGLFERFQLGECRRLDFGPRVFLRLFGRSFERGSNPRLRAVVVPRAGDANIARSVVRMPRSLFLEQSHIRTVCTRVQFAADSCPKRSVYGVAKAWSPLLADPLKGPVYLRSSDNTLPDLVADLRGQVRIELVGRTDSVKGALRNTFEIVPDAPVTKFVLLLQGGQRSLLVASRNLCGGVQRAAVGMASHNGLLHRVRQPIAIPACKRLRKAAKRRAQKRRRAQRARLSLARRAG